MRVAYDISFLGIFFKQTSTQNGVFRVVEQLLFALCARHDVDLNAVAISGDDLLVNVAEASQYFVSRKELDRCEFDPALNRLLSQWYVRTVRRRIPGALDSAKVTHRLTRLVNKVDRPRPVLEAGHYDIFHSPFFPLPGREVTGAVKRFQTIYDLIACKRPDWMPQQINSLVQKIFSSIDHERDWVICISEFTKQEFCEFTGMLPDRVFVAPLAAAEHFRPVEDQAAIDAVRKKYGIPEGDYFLSLGALQPRKNFGRLINSFLELLKQQPNTNVNLVIVGTKAWMYEKLLSSVRDLDQFCDRIIFTEFIDDDDLSAVYSGAKAFVFVSLYEGFGLPVLEAMQCGTPVIAANTTALPEVVGDAGLLVDPRNTDELCSAMLSLLENGPQTVQLKNKSLRRAAEFSWSLCAENTVQAYRSALQSD
jgi:glycosyltransferase involved in cell wall biosynthesis